MNIRSKRGLKSLGVAGAALLATSGLVLTSAPAFAAPGDGGTGSITVFKLEQTDAPIGANDGSIIDSSGATPLVAGFTACSIDDIDLTKSNDWGRLKHLTATTDASGALVVAESGSPLSTTCGAEQTTSATDGSTKFDGLAADKAYVVFESTKPASATSVAQPAILSIPYPSDDAGNWNYNPAIYPKNVIAGSGATKSGSIVGNQASWVITAPINPLASGEKYSEFRITDQLGAHAAYSGGTVELKNAAGDSVALDTSDYTLTPTPPAAGAALVELTFTETGRAKLDANIGGSVVFTLNAEITAAGSTENTATIWTNGASGEVTSPNPENVFDGNYVMKEAKNVGAASNVALAGAHFDVYTLSTAGATECPATPNSSETKVLSDLVSGANGRTSTSVLAAGNYCVYETEVPAGYHGLEGGAMWTVNDNSSSVTVTNVQIGSNPGDLPSLPITGAAGSVLMYATGAGLIALGATLLLMKRRREANQH